MPSSPTFKDLVPTSYSHLFLRIITALQLVKSFDFTFGFCIPGSTNTWDSVYSMPPLSEELSK
jgi:hypothetical protein